MGLTPHEVDALTLWQYDALLYGWNERQAELGGKMEPPTADEYYDAVDRVMAMQDPAVVLEGYDDR